MKRASGLALAWLMLPALASSAQAAPNVVATIKPIHALVASVMEGVGEPALLVKGGTSPHTYSLRPSDAEALENANLVFWTGHGMELFLEDALATLSTDAKVVELAETPGLELLPPREGGAFDAHEHEGDEHGHDEHEGEHEAEADMHFWLDPENAKLMVAAMAVALSEADPENAASYAANAAEQAAALDALAAEIDASLAPAKSKPFLVFHDAYQYFERRFGLSVAGTLTVTPDTMPGAQRIAELRARVAELGPTCVFAEPQFQPAIIAAVTEGTEARTGTLDPEGSDLAEGPGLYGELLRALAAEISACLSR